MSRMIAAAVVLFGCALPVRAEPITYLHNFNMDAGEGTGPQGGVAYSAGRLYGTTYSNFGTIYAVDADGANFQTLYRFATDGSQNGGNVGKPIVVGDSIYGVTEYGFEPTHRGTIWAIDKDGTDFRVLHQFGSGGGGNPLEGMNFIGNRLYGTAPYGGVVPSTGELSSGVLYSLNLDGSDYQVLHYFNDVSAGGGPAAAPILVGPRLYGTTTGGGAGGGGVVYSINPDGSDFQLVYEFPYGYTAQAGVVAVGNRLFGATTGGGSGGGVAGRGTVYGVDIDGSDYQLLHSFSGFDGSQASGDLTTDGSRLYGTTFFGVAYAVGIDGSNFELLHEFYTGGEGDDSKPAGPSALILSGSTLYGTTRYGGPYAGGTVFAIEVPEPSVLVLGIVTTASLFCISVFRTWFLQGRQRNRFH